MPIIKMRMINGTDLAVDKTIVWQAITKAGHKLLGGPYQVEVCFEPDNRMKALARRYLGRSYAADVLSFPLHEFREGKPPDNLPPGPVNLGSVVVNIDEVYRRARSSGHKMAVHVQSLVEHGFLHLIGFHHDLR